MHSDNGHTLVDANKGATMTETTLYVEPTNVEVRHYGTFSVVEITHGVTVHFSATVADDGTDQHAEQAEAFAQRITTPNTPAMKMWLEGIDVRIDGVGTLRPTVTMEDR